MDKSINSGGTCKIYVSQLSQQYSMRRQTGQDKPRIPKVMEEDGRQERDRVSRVVVGGGNNRRRSGSRGRVEGR